MITVNDANPKVPAIAALIAQLDAYQSSLYPAASNHFDSLDELAGAHAHFVAAYDGSRLLGCGAVKYARGDCCYGEIKRVFVRTEARGQGVSKEIMANLEAHARRRGVDALRLETGIHQAEAISLYARLGYKRRAPFGDYPDDPLSVFMEKPLARCNAAPAP